MNPEFANALPIGFELEGYRVVQVLGAGGFGVTYLAEEISIGRNVAVKEYIPSSMAVRDQRHLSVHPLSAMNRADFEWGLDRFRQEARTLVTFNHNNIVTVFRLFEALGTAYLVMEYVEGKPLDAILEASGTLTTAEIAEILYPILDGLDQVHAAGFLHRDIKPANLYVRRNGTPLLIDFGAARQALGRQSMSLTAIVSEGYAPPEQYDSSGTQGPWTDIYALGAVLYRCVSGAQPPPALRRLTAPVTAGSDPIAPALDKVRTHYPPALLAAVDAALRIDPKQRPQSIQALRTTLSGVTGCTKLVGAGRGNTVLLAPGRGETLLDEGTENAGKAGRTASSGRAGGRWRQPSVVVAGLAAAAIVVTALILITPSGESPGIGGKPETHASPLAANPPDPNTDTDTDTGTDTGTDAGGMPEPANPTPGTVASRPQRPTAPQLAEPDSAKQQVDPIPRPVAEAQAEPPSVTRSRRGTQIQADTPAPAAPLSVAKATPAEAVSGSDPTKIIQSHAPAPPAVPEASVKPEEAERPLPAKQPKGEPEQGIEPTAKPPPDQQAQEQTRLLAGTEALRLAKAALAEDRLGDARGKLKEAADRLASAASPDAASPELRDFRNALAALNDRLAGEIAARVDTLVKDATADIEKRHFDAARLKIDRIARLEPTESRIDTLEHGLKSARQPSIQAPAVKAPSGPVAKRALAGDRVAMRELGMKYAQGLGVPQDWRLADRWLTRAAEAGDPVAKNVLGEIRRRMNSE